MKLHLPTDSAALRQFLSNIRRTVAMYWHVDRAGLVWYALFAVVQVAASITATFVGSRLIGGISRYLFTAQTSGKALVVLLVLSTLLFIIENASWQILAFVEQNTYIKWQLYATPAFLNRLATLDLPQFEDSDSRLALDKVREGYYWKPSHYVTELLHLGHALIRLIGVGVAVASLTWWVLPLLMLAGIPTLIAESVQARRAWGIWESEGESKHVYWRITGMMGSRENMGEVKLLGIGNYLADISSKLIGNFMASQQGIMRRFLWVTIVARSAEALALAATQIWLVLKLIHRTVGFTVDKFAYYTGLISQFNSSFSLLTTSLSRLYDNDLFMTDYYRFSDMAPALPRPANPQNLPNGSIPEIVFDNVTFTYPGQKTPVLKAFDFVIKPGEHVALVGENGAGKSTIIKLLLRFYDPQEGRILIGGIDLREINLDQWYELVGTLFQDFNQYPFSIAENIRLGKINAPRRQALIKAAASEAGVDRIVKKLPFGYQTKLDSQLDNGVQPSGGQWQRVALARIFYRRASVLILDEPTAAIDAKAEYEIFNNIFKHYARKTAIIVSHRFSTVRKADRIVVLDAGRIVEQGSHEALLKKGGLYADLFEKQAEGYR